MADELYMFLKCRTASGLPEELVPEAEEINDLWYGAAGSRHPQSDMYTYETVEVKNSVVTARRIELIRNTNLLKVTLSGLEHLTPEVRDTHAANRDTDFKLWAVATDERYKSDNTFDPLRPLLSIQDIDGREHALCRHQGIAADNRPPGAFIYRDTRRTQDSGTAD